MKLNILSRLILILVLCAGVSCAVLFGGSKKKDKEPESQVTKNLPIIPIPIHLPLQSECAIDGTLQVWSGLDPRNVFITSINPKPIKLIEHERIVTLTTDQWTQIRDIGDTLMLYVYTDSMSLYITYYFTDRFMCTQRIDR